MLARLILLSALLLPAWSGAQDYPSKPIRVLHGFPAGGPPDVALRRIATALERDVHQPVIVQNIPGATGMIAADTVARAAPDGYTLLFGVAANLSTGPAMRKSSPYDPKRFTPIAQVARGPYLWLVRSDSPARSMAEFVTWAKERPGKVNFASPGIGSMHQLATIQLERLTGIEMVHVPYATGRMYDGLLSGQVDAMFDSLPGPLPHLKAGTLRALGVSGPARLPLLPDVPTLQEQGISLQASSWWGFVGPEHLPPSLVVTLNGAINRTLQEPEVRQSLHAMGIEPAPASPDEFGRFIAGEYDRWRELVRRTGFQVD